MQYRLHLIAPDLYQTINKLEAKKAELQKPKLNEPLLEFHENNGNKDVNLEVQALQNHLHHRYLQRRGT